MITRALGAGPHRKRRVIENPHAATAAVQFQLGLPESVGADAVVLVQILPVAVGEQWRAVARRAGPDSGRQAPDPIRRRIGGFAAARGDVQPRHAGDDAGHQQNEKPSIGPLLHAILLPRQFSTPGAYKSTSIFLLGLDRQIQAKTAGSGDPA
jgi:hypothetical protein